MFVAAALELAVGVVEAGTDTLISVCDIDPVLLDGGVVSSPAVVDGCCGLVAAEACDVGGVVLALATDD